MDKAKVFISHATPDLIFAERLANDLKAADINVWLDTTHMTSGDFVEQISTALQRDILILVLTPDALESSWVRTEMNTAISRWQQGLMRPPILIMAKPVQANLMPSLWGSLHHHNAMQDYERALVEVIRVVNYGAKPITRPLGSHPDDVQQSVTPAPIHIILEKNQNINITQLGSVVQLEMRWGVSKAAIDAVPGQEFDVDYALFVCHGSTATPETACIRSESDIVYWPEAHHTFPFGTSPAAAAITRSADARVGGNVMAPDETGTIDFAALPADIVRIVLYVHIYKGSTRFMTLDGQRTSQLFKHADVRFSVLGTTSQTQVVAINLGQDYPNNWGIVFCEFFKDKTNEWWVKSILQPIDGDYIDACIQGYHLACS